MPGDIGLEDIPGLAARDVDILGVGRAILDAPMVDLKMDVKHQAPAWVRQRETHADYASRGERTPEMELNLLEKTELRIDGITLEGTNLTDLAEAVAVTLGLPRDKVLVIDVRLGQVALDLLVRTVSAEQVFGRKRALLDALAKIPGVTLRPDAAIHSAGILGAIGLDEEDAPRVIEASRAMTTNILANKRGRIRVFSYRIRAGGPHHRGHQHTVPGEGAGRGRLHGRSRRSGSGQPGVPGRRPGRGLGCLRSGPGPTGGVGAEDKDFSVEAILSLDPEAATPYLVRFTKGEGRHVKDGVRIGVGEYNGCPAGGAARPQRRGAHGRTRAGARAQGALRQGGARPAVWPRSCGTSSGTNKSSGMPTGMGTGITMNIIMPGMITTGTHIKEE